MFLVLKEPEQPKIRPYKTDFLMPCVNRDRKPSYPLKSDFLMTCVKRVTKGLVIHAVKSDFLLPSVFVFLKDKKRASDQCNLLCLWRVLKDHINNRPKTASS